MNADTKRATVYLDATLHTVLESKAVERSLSIFDLVNDAIRESLAEEADDLDTCVNRVDEPSMRFGKLVADMKRRGRL